MSPQPNARRLVVAAETEERNPSNVGLTPASADPLSCSFCFGTGMEVIVGKGARRCQCRSRNAQTTLLEAARIPRRYKECSLSNYQPASNNGSQLRAFKLAYRLVREYPVIDRGLLLMGQCGVGKTHLAAAIIRGLVEKGVHCLFYECGALLKQLQESYNALAQTSELKLLAPVYEAEVLVLDELGGSKPTDWVRDTMMSIISARYNDKKLTICTTNYLDTRCSPMDDTLEDRVGVRQRSRLYEMCRTLVIEGEDYRQHFDGT